jgi:FtsH-binding integral membrane protein
MGKLEVFNKLLIKKSSLLQCIFSTLIFQMLLTTLVFRHVHQNPTTYKNILEKNTVMVILLFFVIQIALIFSMTTMDITFASRFIIFIIFSIIEGLFLGASMVYVPKDIIMSALVSTVAIFATFLAVGMFIVYLGIDLGWMGIYLFLGLLGLIITRIVSSIMKPDEPRSKYSTIFGLLLFSVFILYDTNNILLKYSTTGVDCIRGALDYYLDLVNIFVQSVDSN